MGMLAWLFGSLGGLCAVMGIVIALKVIPEVKVAGLTWVFWFSISAILLLASIAFAAGRSEYE